MGELESQVIEVLTFRRQNDSGSVEVCRVEVYDDGSVFVDGDEFDLVFGEPNSQSRGNAIAHIESLGFQLTE
jgi:hypothetical protein